MSAESLEGIRASEAAPSPSPFLAGGADGSVSPEALAALLEGFTSAFEEPPASSSFAPVTAEHGPFVMPRPADHVPPELTAAEEWFEDASSSRWSETGDNVGYAETPPPPAAISSEQPAVGLIGSTESVPMLPAETAVEPQEAFESSAAVWEEVEDLMSVEEAPPALADPAGEARLVASAHPGALGLLEAVVGEVIPLERQAAPGAVATRLTVSVRTDFTVRRGGRVEFDWRPGEPVGNAQVAVVGTPIAAVTSPRGVAVLDMTGLPDGDHLVRLSHRQRDRSTTDPAGPAVADPLPARPSRIYRILDVRIRTVAGLLRAAWIAPGDTHGGIGNRTQATFSQGHLPVDWKPVWMRSPMKATEAMRAANAIDLVVVHHTGGPRIGPAINTFLSQGSVANAHYVIDHDGHVVKTAEDLRRANHAGTSRWRGRTGLNVPSIGIEIVNESGPFSAAQYTSLLVLLQQLRTSYPTIPAHRIVGHSDIATTNGQPSLLSDRRAEDPGVEFDWATLEGRSLGMVPISTNLGVYYAGIFSGALGNAPIALRRGDRDAAPDGAAIVGGVRRPGFTGTPVRELQEDLEHIGYSVRPAGGAMGTFNLHTERAVDRFQRHFFAGTRNMFRAGRLGRVDALTANWIKTVRAGIPP